MSPSQKPGAPRRPGQLVGLPASPGIAIGPLAHAAEAAIAAVSREPAADAEVEWQRLAAALDRVRAEMRMLRASAEAEAGEAEAAIFDAQGLLLDDPSLLDPAAAGIRSTHLSAEAAWHDAVSGAAKTLLALTDPYLQARAADVQDVGRRVLLRLAGGSPPLLRLARPSILVAPDLAPSQVKDLNPDEVLGLCLEGGSPTAHALILARALGIPAVTGAGPALGALPAGTLLAVDGTQGRVWLSPGPAELQALESRHAAWLASRLATFATGRAPARTRDARHIPVLANISGVEDARLAVERGAEGVGLLRTEFLFLARRAAPGEAEQLAAYHAIAGALGGRPLVIRTLDVGGDKHLPYLDPGPEANPFLGLRGLRLSLARPELFVVQLRAVLRLAADHPVRVMFPLVSTPQELQAARSLLREAETQLAQEGLAHASHIESGIMIEVPAAVACADRLAEEAHFFSLGTNDLAQYVMAADRTNARVAALADPLQPAVLRMIGQVAQAARRANIGVALCGELAADAAAVPLLLGLGVSELSVNVAALGAVRRAIAAASTAESEALAAAVLDLRSAVEVRRYLGQATI